MYNSENHHVCYYTKIKKFNLILMKKLFVILLSIAALAGSYTYGNCKVGETDKNHQYQCDSSTAKISNEGSTKNQTLKHLDILCNRFGGRLLGSDSYTNAAEWCAYMFKKWGVEVIQEEAGELPVGFNRGPWFGRMIGGNGMVLHFATPSYTSGTKGVQRGHVLREPKTTREFERIKGALKGAWVLIDGESTGWPIDYTPTGDPLRNKIIAENDNIVERNEEAYYYNRKIRQERGELKKQMLANPKEKGKLQKKLDALKEREIEKTKEIPALFYKEMREAGMIGIIQSAPVPITALYDRKNVEKMTFETLPEIPDIKLDEDQFRTIAAMVDRREYFQLEFDIRNHFKMGPVKFYNIIGMIRGSEYPDEYVMAGGHLDAFDVATGGVDCGVGATVSLEAARLLAVAGAKPKRSILLCLWAGEEYGLWGSKFFVEHNSEKMSKVSNYINRDGGPTVPLSITVSPATYDDFVKVCEPVNLINKEFPFTVKKRVGEPQARPKSAGAGGSDHAPFMVYGVPTFSFSTGDPKGYNFSYGEIWHTERDTYDKSIPEYQKHASTVTAVVLYGIANLDHLLSRENLYK